MYYIVMYCKKKMYCDWTNKMKKQQQQQQNKTKMLHWLSNNPSG